MMHSKLVQTKIKDVQAAIEKMESEGYELLSFAPVYSDDVLMQFVIEEEDKP